MNKKMGIFFLLLFSLSFSSIIRINGVTTGTTSTTNIENSNAITINGNSNFTLKAQVEHWSGNGSFSSPIIISSLTNLLSLNFKIANTNLFFEISHYNIVLNNNLYMSFTNVSNGIISNNTFNGNESYESNFMILRDCSNFIITNNNFYFVKNTIVTPNEVGSFYITGSSNILFSNNKVTNETYGLITTYCQDFNNNVPTTPIPVPCGNEPINTNITVTNNFFSLKIGLGIRAKSGVVSNNVFDNSGLKNTINYYSDYGMNYSNNTLNGRSIIISKSQSNIVLPPNAGEVILDKSNNIAVVNAQFFSSPDSIMAYACNNITIKDSTFNDIRYGAVFNEVDNSHFVNNSMSNSYLDWENSRNNFIIGNIISNGTESGISLLTSSNNLIMDNKVFNNSDGIDIENAGSNNITNNSIYNNGNGFGIKLSNSSYNSITFNEIFNNSYGMFIGGENNVVENNDIYNNKYAGIQGKSFAEISNTITNNNFQSTNATKVNNSSLNFLNDVVLVIMIVIAVSVFFYITRSNNKRNHTLKAKHNLETTSILCKGCGHVIDPGTNFCINCGRRVD